MVINWFYCQYAYAWKVCSTEAGPPISSNSENLDRGSVCFDHWDYIIGIIGINKLFENKHTISSRIFLILFLYWLGQTSFRIDYFTAGKV